MIAAMYTSDMGGGIYTSTVGTYGQAEIFRESELWDKNPSPNDWFAGWAKRMGEVQIDAYQQQYGEQNISIMKPVNIYGKYDNFNLATSTLVPSLVRKVVEATDSVEIWGDGSAGRDIIHARDVARAAMFLVENNITQPVNVGNGRCVTVKELIETLVKVSGKDLEITHDMTKPKGDSFRVADISRLRDHGFQSTVSLEEGLKETFDWFIANNPYEGRHDPFLKADYTNMIEV
jgi:GDP-L-fucose synthase